MKQEERRQKIRDILTMVPIATVLELSERLNVTPETVRKDLAELSGNGEIVRIHGGAALAGESEGIVPYASREMIHNQEKLDIGKAAVELIEPGDSLLLEGSTTVTALCSALLEKEALLKTLTIITNSFHIAKLLNMGERCAKLFFLGGFLSSSEQVTRGHSTTESLHNFTVNKAILSGAALGENLMVSTYYENDLEFQRTAMRCADKTIILLDSSKYPETAIFAVAHLTEFHYMVTGIQFDLDKKKLLKDKKVKVIEI